MKLTRRQVGLAAAGAFALSRAQAQSAGQYPYVIDLHCDTPMRILAEGFDLGKRNDYGQVDIPRMRDGGVTALFLSVYTESAQGDAPGKVQRALEIIDGIQREVARHPQDLVMAASADDIDAAKQAGKMAMLLGVEGGYMINSSLGVLRSLYRLGARYMTLTHSQHLAWAGSSGGDAKSDPGLTDFGREVVAEMNRLGMMVDISHVSDKTFWGAVETSQAPVIASHSSCRALAEHPRNMTDEMIRKVADGGGVVHINFYNAFIDADYRARSNAPNPFRDELRAVRSKGLTGEALARAEWDVQIKKVETLGRTPFSVLLDHFEHAAKVGGVEAVGLGSDFDGVTEELPEKMEDVSMFPNLIDGLKSRGFSEADVAKMLGGNSMRVLRDVEAAANRS